MQIIVKNNIEIIEPNQDIWEYCYNQLTIDNPTYITAKKLGKYLGNIPPKMKLYYINGNKVILPFGCLNQVWKIIKYDKSLLINQISPFKPLNLKGNINLYMYQKKALEALKMGKNGILEAPCGSGKTQIGLALIKSIGGRALWLTHTEKLLNQSLERCRAYYNGDFGTITQGGGEYW